MRLVNDVTIIRYCQRFHSVRSYEPVDLEMAKFARFSADEVRRPILAACWNSFLFAEAVRFGVRTTVTWQFRILLTVFGGNAFDCLARSGSVVGSTSRSSDCATGNCWFALIRGDWPIDLGWTGVDDVRLCATGRISSETRLKLGYSVDFADILLVLGLEPKFGAGVLPLVGVDGVVADVDVVRYLPFDVPFIANGLIWIGVEWDFAWDTTLLT